MANKEKISLSYNYFLIIINLNIYHIIKVLNVLLYCLTWPRDKKILVSLSSDLLQLVDFFFKTVMVDFCQNCIIDGFLLYLNLRHTLLIILQQPF